jgi:hypothetical protein
MLIVIKYCGAKGYIKRKIAKIFPKNKPRRLDTVKKKRHHWSDFLFILFYFGMLSVGVELSEPAADSVVVSFLMSAFFFSSNT